MSEPRLNRRQVFGYASAAGLGGAAGIVTGRATAGAVDGPQQPVRTISGQRYSPWGPHQTGIHTPKPAAARLLAFDLHPDTDVAALARLMRVWGGSIAALMEGRPTAADRAPDLAQEAVSLTIGIGWGPGVFDLPGMERHRPAGFMEIPPMDHDRLQERWMGGDLVCLLSADDSTTLDYASRRLTLDARPFAAPRWVQNGSWRGTDADGAATTGRNLFGQVDGTAGPTDAELDSFVWSRDGWFTGGTQLVVRRIEMDLDDWDSATRDRQEKSLGRDLATGAPLTGGEEHTEMDLDATVDGQPVIAVDAHARLSHPSQNRGRTMLRRSWNYTHTDDAGHTTAGLIFLAFQNNIADVFIPVQRRLDLQDALNEWIVHIGSATFAMLPGWEEDTWPGHQLLAQLS